LVVIFDARRRRHSAVALTVAAVAATGALGACGSSSTGAGPAPSGSVTPTKSVEPSPLSSASAASVITVLVTNDDGVKAPGIDTLVQALRKVSGITVKVVAPATNQSGAGGKTTAGSVTFTNTTTLSGYPAVAVNGTPADAANVAFDQLHLTPSVVISGANAGQNLGPVVDISGTVGAARVGARHGLPALAVSSGTGTKFDFATAAAYAVKWFGTERSSLPSGPSSTAATVSSLNVPTCGKGKVRGELTLKQQLKLLAGQSILGTSNCLSTAHPTTEVAAFSDGFATLVSLPLNPAT
jgi:5'-nucleotidase